MSAFERAFILTGPTACGKSALALDLAERIGGEVVALDSMTVYRGMDLGTAKPTAADRARVPGGSSSGGAVAAGDGMCEISIGSDTGGSTRIPAAFCGIVGYKPSRLRITRDGAYPLSFSMDSIGPMARSVADCQRADAAMAGEERAPLAAPSLGDFLAALALGLGEHVGRVAALGRMHLAPVDVPGPLADGVQQPAVVADHDDRAVPILGPVAQVATEPVDRLDVQVVGRLVEQQHVRSADEHLREEHPKLEPARQGRQPLPMRRRRDPEALENRARPRLQRVLAEGLHHQRLRAPSHLALT